MAKTKPPEPETPTTEWRCTNPECRRYYEDDPEGCPACRTTVTAYNAIATTHPCEEVPLPEPPRLGGFAMQKLRHQISQAMLGYGVGSASESARLLNKLLRDRDALAEELEHRDMLQAELEARHAALNRRVDELDEAMPSAAETLTSENAALRARVAELEAALGESLNTDLAEVLREEGPRGGLPGGVPHKEG